MTYRLNDSSTASNSGARFAYCKVKGFLNEDIRHRFLIILLTLFSIVPALRAQEEVRFEARDTSVVPDSPSGWEEITEFMITYPLAKSVVDTTFGDNAAVLRRTLDLFKEIEEDSLRTLIGVTFCGTASPEGTSRINRKLSRERMLALEEYVRSRVDIPDSMVTYNDGYIPWDWLGTKVEESCMRYKEDVLAVIRDSVLASKYLNDFNSDPRTHRLQKIRDGIPWTEISVRWFEEMRSASAIVLNFKQLPPPASTSCARALYRA